MNSGAVGDVEINYVGNYSRHLNGLTHPWELVTWIIIHITWGIIHVTTGELFTSPGELFASASPRELFWSPAKLFTSPGKLLTSPQFQEWGHLTLTYNNSQTSMIRSFSLEVDYTNDALKKNYYKTNKTSSQLSNGNWYKFSVTNNGVVLFIIHLTHL